MGIPFSLEVFNAREEVESSDLVRAQKLISRDVQDVLRDSSRNDDTAVAITGVFQNGAGSPINAADLLPVLTAPGGSYLMALTAGQGYFNDTSLTGDDSTYTVVRWAAQNLTFTNPDPVNPRVDLVYAVPASVNTDLASRNILTDPVARTVAPQSVSKTQNPLASIVVLAGVPAATNPPPGALPAGALALFEVWVPALAADSTTFLIARRLFRRQPAMVSSYHGILRNCIPLWSDVQENIAPQSSLSFSAVTTAINKVVIDGEVISWVGGTETLPAAAPMIVQDALNNPLLAAAGTSDVPYYLYIVGGRNSPQAGLEVSSIIHLLPVRLVESLTAPRADGHPSSAIQPPRGAATIAGALYIGIGFKVAGTIRRKGCTIEGDWVYANTGIISGGGLLVSGFTEPTRVIASTNQRLFSRPIISTAADVSLVFSDSAAAPVDQQVQSFVSTFTDRRIFTLNTYLANAAAFVYGHRRVALRPYSAAVGSEEFRTGAVAATQILALFATAYNMKVPRLSE